MLEEIYRPGNRIIWFFDGTDSEPNEENDYDGLLAEVGEIIDRSPTPFGMDKGFKSSQTI